MTIATAPPPTPRPKPKAPAPPPATPPTPSPAPSPHQHGLPRITVEQYHQMIKDGWLLEGARLELIRGVIVLNDKSAAGDKEEQQMPVGDDHAFVVEEIRLIDAALRAEGCSMRQQSPITLPLDGEPEPDSVIIRGSNRDYLGRKPTPDDVLAVIEVSDSSLATDRGVKLELYAEAKIPLYVIVNLPDRCLEVHREPTGLTYADREVLTGDATLTLPTPGEPVTVRAADWLPPV
jgi:Uma2 family endonuclease